MKKSQGLIMILILAIALGGCASSPKASAPEKTLQTQIPESGEKSAQTQDTLLILKDVAQMFAPCAQIASYMAVSAVPIDMQKPSAEDFWLILSMVTYAAKPDSVGEFGTIDLKEEVVKDIAATFFSELLKQSKLPSPAGTYSAAYIGAEALYELQPMSISDMTSQMTSLEEVNSEEGKYLMTIKLVDEKQRTQKVEWLVYLDDWEDGRQHFFPYQFVQALSLE